jgi:hypothetical protein
MKLCGLMVVAFRRAFLGQYKTREWSGRRTEIKEFYGAASEPLAILKFNSAMRSRTRILRSTVVLPGRG